MRRTVEFRFHWQCWWHKDFQTVSQATHIVNMPLTHATSIGLYSSNGSSYQAWLSYYPFLTPFAAGGGLCHPGEL
jgi:hypothetical protein